MGTRWERIEKRVDRRFSIPVRTIVSFTNASTQDLKTFNISAGGAYFKTNHPNQEGAEVYMTLFTEETPDRTNLVGPDIFVALFDEAIPTQEMLAIKLKGKVVRSYRDGMAVRFDRQFSLEWM